MKYGLVIITAAIFIMLISPAVAIPPPIVKDAMRTTVSMINSPQAMYSNKTDSTYTVWQDNDAYGDIYINCYNHSTQTLTDSYFVAENPLYADGHGNPILFISNGGYINVLYGAHDDKARLHQVTSKKPITHGSFSLDEWTTPKEIFRDRKLTYPILRGFKDKVIMIYRDKTHGAEWRYVLTDDNLTSWNNITAFISLTDSHFYLFNTDYQSKRIYFTGCRAESHSIPFDRWNIYAGYLQAHDLSTYSYAGDFLGVTINDTELEEKCLVWDTGRIDGFKVNVPRIKVSKDGNIHIISQYRTDIWYYTHFEYATNWTMKQICSSQYYNNAPIFEVHEEKLVAFLPRYNYVEKWNYDGETWYNETRILRYNHLGQYGATGTLTSSAVYNAHPDYRFLMGERADNYTWFENSDGNINEVIILFNISLRIWAYGDQGFLTWKNTANVEEILGLLVMVCSVLVILAVIGKILIDTRGD